MATIWHIDFQRKVLPRAFAVVAVILVLVTTALCWHFFRAGLTCRPWCKEDGIATRFPDARELYPEVPWLIRPATIVSLSVVEGRLGATTCLNAELHLVRNGGTTLLSSLTASRSASLITCPRPNVTIIVGCVTFHTSDGDISVLAVEGCSHSGISCRPFVYSPFSAAFEKCAAGTLSHHSMIVVSARGDREPTLLRDMTVEQFVLSNPAGNHLILAVRQTD